MTRWLGLVAALACACSTKQPPPASVPCVVHFSNDVDDTVTATSCGVSSDEAGQTFTAHATGNAIAAFDVSIALPAPSGTFSSETAAPSWSVTATTGDAGCIFSGGDTDVPAGSFTLTIDGDGGSTAHGTLTAILYVHAPPLTNCGPRDVESVELTF